MSTTDTNVPQVIVNKLTKAQYDTAVKSPTEFYAVTDGQIETADIADGAVTTAKIATGAVTSDKIDFATYTGNNAINFDSTYVGTVSTANLVKKGGIFTAGATFQATAAAAENQPFATLVGVKPPVRTYFPMTGGGLGFVEPNGNIYKLNGLATGWHSFGITGVVDDSA